MLLQLSIRNFAIFKDTTIDFSDGFNVITGESGAGKSVFITALSLINGERGFKEYIRKGCDFSSVEAVYRLKKDLSETISNKFDIDTDDNMLVITRTIYTDSNSVCKVNGKIRNLTFLKDIAEYLCDIHGQYENQTLLNPLSHQRILDSLYQSFIKTSHDEYIALLDEYNTLVDFILKNSGSEQQRAVRRDILAYQIDEIVKSKVEQFDIEELEKQSRILENSEKYITSLRESINLIEENDSIEKIYLSAHLLNKLKDMDELLAVSQSMMNCYYILKDNFSQLKDISDQFYFDEETYDGIIKKLELFKKLSYKYGTTVEEITAFRQDAEKQLHDIDNFDNIYKEKIQRIEKLSELLYEKGELLNGLRVKAAEHFSKSVETNLHSLEMPDAVFNVHFEKNLKKNTLGYYDFNRKGLYDIEFLISVNKGIDPLPMAKIASGGEISRIMLAIKCIISNNDDIETYIFDEIDSGVSGEAAIMTANKLYELSASKQVISITHLPQIAAKADHHYLISKYSDEDSTYADIKKLTHNERINQLAILFDGKKVSQEGLEYAKNLLDKMKESDSIRVALREVQEGFIGEAERLGLKTEADVVETVKQFRKEKREK
ncbi:MAG TPA: DNA repair protein RecN [Clostridia bacterium]|nr:DNA repair protein RecN [Clostridiaceae bacterium]HOF25912.1 DNA repair protein RecN [Clostridia bacterium]HOM33645.1 DNA repair protein RecN [Clostridia bacterium]HOR88937.1 DNA repair protein RecN [Clostridia bacterium]HOT71280.1 DNA repair protein RecN [Clostridia bacterium]